MFEWAARQRPGWRPNYFLALIRWHLGDLDEARRRLTACGDAPRFAPFYAARAQLAKEDALRAQPGVRPSPGAAASASSGASELTSDPAKTNVAAPGDGRTPSVRPGSTLADLQRAALLDPAQWRYGVMLVRHFLERGDPATALTVASDYAQRFPANGTLALLRAKVLLLSGQYWAAAEILGSLHVLPAEGTTEAHALYREANLLLAVSRLQTGALDDALRLVALARQWPERLGAGKPYPADVDERLEDWLTAQCHVALKAPPKARQALNRILAFPARPKGQGTGDLIRAMALRQSGRLAEAEGLLRDWQAQDPESDLAKWGAELFAGRPAPLTASLPDLDCRVLAGIALAGFHPEPWPSE